MVKMKYCPICASKLVKQKIDGVNRLGCSSESCNYVFWDNPNPVVAAIVEMNDGVVLIRNKGWPRWWYGIVTGYLEKGETPEQGVLREVREELGLNADIVSFVGYYSFSQLNQLILAFHVRAEGEITIGDELESCKLVPPAELKPWSIGTGPAVKDWLEARQRER